MRWLLLTCLFCTSVFVSCSFGEVWSIRCGSSARLNSSNEFIDPWISPLWDIGYTTLALVSPVADAFHIYTVVSTDGENNSIIVLDKWTGKLVSDPFILPESFTYTIAIDSKYVYVSADMIFYCLTKVDLEIVWQQNVNDENVFSIVPGQMTLYGVTDQGNVFAVHKETGVFKWRYQLNPDFNYRWVTLGSDFIIVTGSAQGENISMIYCLHPNGEKAWNLRFKNDSSIPPQVTGNILLVCEIGKVSALDIKTGATIWFYYLTNEYQKPISVDCSPAILGKFIYLVYEGNLYRLSIDFGVQKEFIVIPTRIPVKTFFVTPASYFIFLDGDPFLLVYDCINSRFVKKFNGGRNVLGTAVSGGVIMQSTVGITLLR